MYMYIHIYVNKQIYICTCESSWESKLHLVNLPWLFVSPSWFTEEYGLECNVPWKIEVADKIAHYPQWTWPKWCSPVCCECFSHKFERPMSTAHSFSLLLILSVTHMAPPRSQYFIKVSLPLLWISRHTCSGRVCI